MELWIEKNACTGCAACANSCPLTAIKMETDFGDFSYPAIDSKTCNDCNLCIMSCPIKNGIEKEATLSNPKVYVAWNLDGNSRYHSTSGGLFSVFSNWVINDNNGIIIGAQYGKNHMIEHASISTIIDLPKIRQSKYAESRIGDILKQVKDYLNYNRTVLFCGCPCQVAGLHSFLGRSYENLYTFDFICRGSNSPKAYRKWLDMLERDYKSKVKRVWFKNKELGWNKFSSRVDFENGKIYRKDRYNDLFMKGYLEYNLYIRPVCTKCPFKGFPRSSDITLADFWAVDKRYDHDIGSSLVIINTKHGKELFNSIQKNIYFNERTLAEARKGNGMLDKSTWLHPKSKDFLISLDSVHFDVAFYRLFRKNERKKKLKLIYKRITTFKTNIACKYKQLIKLVLRKK